MWSDIAHFLQYSLLGTSNMVSISYVIAISTDMFILTYFVLWFFKREFHEVMIPSDIHGISLAIWAFIVNFSILVQIVEQPEGYYPVAFYVQGIAVLCVLAAGSAILGVIGICKLRERIPGRY